MASTKVPVKSILKQPKSTTLSDDQKAKVEKDRHNLNIALQHAYKIQDQKDWQARIVKAIEVLLDYPRTPSPSSDDATGFVQLVQPFQPSDLDSLVEERRIDGKCGYVLCGKIPRIETVGKAAEWRLGKGMSDFCSNSCGKKTMYVKAQLSSVPAWERMQDYRPDIQVHPDDRPVLVAAKPKSAARPRVANDDAELALERGEKSTSFKPQQVMTDRIVEKAAVVHKPLSSVHGAVVSSTAIEGYEPQRKFGGQRAEKDDSDDDVDEQDDEGGHEDEVDDEGD